MCVLSHPRIRVFLQRISPQLGGCEHQLIPLRKALDDMFPKLLYAFSTVTPVFMGAECCKKSCKKSCKLFLQLLSNEL